MFPTLEDGIVGMRDEVLEMGLLIRRRRNLVLPTVTCDKSHIVCDNILLRQLVSLGQKDFIEDCLYEI